MNPSRQPDDDLADTLDRVLRELPLRTAPPGLERRVLDALERRAARPWWRRNFAHWPPFARSGFVTLCGSLIWLTIVAGGWYAPDLEALDGRAAASMIAAEPVMAALAWVASLAALLAHAIPPAVWYAALGFGALLYGVLFGISATAYRTLYLIPSAQGDPA